MVRVCSVLLFLLVACNSEVKLQPYPDPFVNSFRGKGIKEAHGVLKVDGVEDTVQSFYIDTSSHVIKINWGWGRQYSRYNDLNYLTRRWEVSDLIDNYRIDYSYDPKSNLLTQHWKNLESREWEVDTTTIAYYAVHGNKIKLELDEEGKVIKANDSLVCVTEFSYNNNLLIKQVENYFSVKHVTEKIFEYDDLNRLSKIITRFDDREGYTDYFSEGILSYSDFGNKKVEYKYVYY